MSLPEKNEELCDMRIDFDIFGSGSNSVRISEPQCRICLLCVCVCGTYYFWKLLIITISAPGRVIISSQFYCNKNSIFEKKSVHCNLLLLCKIFSQMCLCAFCLLQILSPVENTQMGDFLCVCL